MSACLSCGGAVAEFLSFGRMPVANAFLRAEDLPSEFFFELKAGFCPSCALVQLVDPLPRERLFHDQYPFFTSSSRGMVAHFEDWARDVARACKRSSDPFVVEIGGNDGALLAPLARQGIRHLGVEPSASVAAEAEKKGVKTLRRFFDEESSRVIVAAHGQADFILAANCFCHVADLRGLGAALKVLLKPEGSVLFEDPYLADIIEKTAYDQIYDEHASYFSALSVSRWAERHGLALVGLAPQKVHGGSMRYTLRRRGPAAPAVTRTLAAEKTLGLDRLATFTAFRARVERSRDELVALLTELKRQGKRVAGYAATSKSATVFNYAGIGADLVEYICDTTPLKQGRLSPGAHIPIRPHEEFAQRYPDYALLLAWNHADEIAAKEGGFARAGGKWITYVPRVAIA